MRKYLSHCWHIVDVYSKFFPSLQELPNPAPEWITPRCWREIQALERLSKFDKFVTSFQFSLTQFKHIFDTQEAHL